MKYEEVKISDVDLSKLEQGTYYCIKNDRGDLLTRSGKSIEVSISREETVITHVLLPISDTQPLDVENPNKQDLQDMVLNTLQQNTFKKMGQDVVHADDFDSIVSEIYNTFSPYLKEATVKEEVNENNVEKSCTKCVQVFYGKECIFPHCRCDKSSLSPLKEAEQEPELFCTGCGLSNKRPIGLNKNGEPFIACCPDSNYQPKEAEQKEEVKFHRSEILDKFFDYENVKAEIEKKLLVHYPKTYFSGAVEIDYISNEYRREGALWGILKFKGLYPDLLIEPSPALTPLEDITEKEKEIKVLKSIIEDCKGINPEYIIENIEERISILKHGI